VKQPTKLGSAATVQKNLELAQKVLGELGYLCFQPAGHFDIRNGHLALRRDNTNLCPAAVLLFSRGSFLELRAMGMPGNVVLRRLRARLWVPIHHGEDLAQPTKETLASYVEPSERRDLSLLSV
jgi:hypothetical protein